MEPVTRRHHGGLLKCLFRRQAIFGMPLGLDALYAQAPAKSGPASSTTSTCFLQYSIPSDFAITRFLAPQIPSNFDAFRNGQAPENSGPTSSTTNTCVSQYLILCDSDYTFLSPQKPFSFDAFRRRKAKVNAGSCHSAVHDVFAGIR